MVLTAMFDSPPRTAHRSAYFHLRYLTIASHKRCSCSMVYRFISVSPHVHLLNHDERFAFDRTLPQTSDLGDTDTKTGRFWLYDVAEVI